MTIYIAAEAGRSSAPRVQALCRRLETDDFPLALVPCPVNLMYDDAAQKEDKDKQQTEGTTRTVIKLVRQVEQQTGLKCTLVVIDTLARAFAGGNENDSEDMGRFVRNVDRIRRATGAAVLVVHHSGKNAAAGARGHSSLRAATDTELELVVDKDGVRTLNSTKQRDIEAAPPIRLALIPVILGQDEDGEDIASCVVSIEGEPAFDFVGDRGADRANEIERERIALAEFIAGAMARDRMPISEVEPLVMGHTGFGKSKVREQINDAVPLSGLGCAVVVAGVPWFLRREKQGTHKTAPTYLVRTRATPEEMH